MSSGLHEGEYHECGAQLRALLSFDANDGGSRGAQEGGGCGPSTSVQAVGMHMHMHMHTYARACPGVAQAHTTDRSMQRLRMRVLWMRHVVIGHVG